jgi:hypothetical protein
MGSNSNNKITGPGHERRSQNVFELAQLIHEGKPHRAMRVYCCNCGKPGTCIANALRFGVGADCREERMIARKFTNLGWDIDLRKGKHHCPECQMPIPVKRQKPDVVELTQDDISQEEQMTEATVVPMPTSKPMSREDRRIIFEKLNEVYANEAVGYEAPWTDDKVARDLGIPRAWVTQMREENFGPAQSNVEIDEAVKAAKELAAEVVKHAEASQKLSHAVDLMLRRLDVIIKAVGK